MSEIPVLYVEGDTIPEAWEKSLIRLWREGMPIKTEYDRPGDPPSRDCTMMMVIRDPFAEPRLHRAFPAGLDDLEVYRQEVVEGVHDHWIAPEEGKWTYTYHKRLFGYESEGRAIDQLDYVVAKLAEAPHTRRAQAITWDPALDIPTYDPPCLQRLWFRLTEDEGEMALNMNSHWRSRDAYKAAFMNIFALTDLQRVIAGRLSEKLDRPVRPGRYVDIADSYHIYGSYFEEFKGFLETVENRSFEERTWNSDFAEPFFEMGRERLAAERDK
ncbi:MAG: thymidylate synthase [bacterium]|nr:thymidylate synthase [bacterium]